MDIYLQSSVILAYTIVSTELVRNSSQQRDEFAFTIYILHCCCV